MEIWKKIDFFDGYLISNLGNIKSLERVVNVKNKSNRKRSGRVLKPSKNYKGYFIVVLQKDKIRKTIAIHRIVASYFLKYDNERTHVNHINGIKTDNRADNLEWCNVRENNNHRQINKITTSNYTGVSFNKNTQKWRAEICIKTKTKYLGEFKSEIEAYQSRVNFEQENNIVNKYL